MIKVHKNIVLEKMRKHCCVRQNNDHIPDLYTLNLCRKHKKNIDSRDRAQLVEFLPHINEALGSISNIT